MVLYSIKTMNLFYIMSKCDKNSNKTVAELSTYYSDSFTILGLWVLPISMSPNCKLNTIFNDKSAILLHPGTRQDSLK